MNLPNKITTVRIILIPFMIFFYLANFVPFGKLISLGIFIIAACTDFIDGYIARSRNLVTNLGKFLDPVADKLLITAGLLLIVADGTVPAPYGVIAAIIILAREMIITAFRTIAATNNVIMAADKGGKIKAIFQDIAVPAFILLAAFYEYGWLAENSALLVFEIVAYILLGIATILTIYSGIGYIIKNKHVLKEKTHDKN